MFDLRTFFSVSGVWAFSFLTNRDGGYLFVLLSSQISDQAAGIITWYRTHQHRSARLHLQTRNRNISNRFNNTDDGKRLRGEKILVNYLVIHDVSQVKRLLDDVHEALSKHLWDENVRHGEQTVGAEGLNQQQLVNCLANGGWTGKSRTG